MRKSPPPPRQQDKLQRDNRVRIIGGRWRGRKIGFPDVDGLRPTGDRIRETLFNWLAPHISGARCLDLFAGSGALGFEALSRGAASCLMVETHAAALKCLRDARALLDAEGAELIASNATSWLQQQRQAAPAFDIVFLDPPFADVSLQPAALMACLLAGHLLAEGALVYVEQPVEQAPLSVPGFQLHRTQQAGRVRYSLFRYAQESENPL